MFDLNTFDSPGNVINNFQNFEEFMFMKEKIFNQITQFDNFGIDFIKEIEDQNVKIEILRDIILYVNDNYLDIVDIDNILSSENFILEMGYYIYLFLVMDCYNSILPNFVKITNIIDYNQIDYYLRYKSNNIKPILLKSVQLIIEPLLKLQNIDPSIIKDVKYKAFLKRITYGLDLLDYGQINNFVNNFMIPVLRKHFEQIMWRAL